MVWWVVGGDLIGGKEWRRWEKRAAALFCVSSYACCRVVFVYSIIKALTIDGN
jgi:hypothetical protein